MSAEASGTLFLGFVQPPTGQDTWDETWYDAADIIEHEGSKRAQKIQTFLLERGVEWKTFGWEDGYFWHALSIRDSELDFGCESPQIVKMQHFQNRPEVEWISRLIECARELKLNPSNLVANWYIGSSYI